MPRLQGLIFDLDGTLLDSAPDLRQALNAMLGQRQRHELTLDEVKRLTGDGLTPMITRAFDKTGGVPPDFDLRASTETFFDYYTSLRPDPAQIYPGGREMLEKFSALGVRLGLCTNKQEAATLRLMEELNLRHHFTFIAGGDTFSFHKPHPAHVKGVVERLEAEASSCVMIGDSSNDVLAAHGAGLKCIAVTHGYGQNMESLGADLLIGGFGELGGALSRLGFQL